MKREEIHEIVEKQRAFFNSDKTRDVNFRIEALKKLHAALERHEENLNEALQKDLKKSAFESFMCETGLCYGEAKYMIKHVKAFAKDKTVGTPLAQFHSHSFKRPSPKGVVLIMSPWNYPVQLTIVPLIDAIAAGNTVIVKPSSYSPATSAAMKQMLAECFPPEYVTVIEGGRQENGALLEEKFDHILFTGSQNVGKTVMAKAAEHLTPVTLELGGKNPCIVDKTANLKLTARRLVWGKYLNCGQTCVAPDFLFVDASIKDALIEEFRAEIKRQYGENILENPIYGKIINEKHFNRILGLIKPEKTVIGGGSNPDTLQIEPTVMDGVTFADPVMQEEIFGPVLPILTYESLDGAIEKVCEMQHPLAMYIFSSDKANIDKVLSKVGFGGSCVNDSIIHLATSNMGFGGFGESGMGSYHGKTGFDTFSHTKSVVDKKTWVDMPVRYHPSTPMHEKLVRFLLK